MACEDNLAGNERVFLKRNMCVGEYVPAVSESDVGLLSRVWIAVSPHSGQGASSQACFQRRLISVSSDSARNTNDVSSTRW